MHFLFKIKFSAPPLIHDDESLQLQLSSRENHDEKFLSSIRPFTFDSFPVFGHFGHDISPPGRHFQLVNDLSPLLPGSKGLFFYPRGTIKLLSQIGTFSFLDF